ncbi:MAG: nucleotide pyrophosphohydrolase [Armatimonadetes bacterium]|nr:nucleotide pyrophosphohydrolase [Armatimonadota bacterium]
MTIAQFQEIIRQTYHERDAGRGLPKTFMWLVEEVGELARALQNDDPQALREEFADVLAWLTTLASIAGVDLEEAAQARYGQGCPKCHSIPCQCERGALE